MVSTTADDDASDLEADLFQEPTLVRPKKRRWTCIGLLWEEVADLKQEQEQTQDQAHWWNLQDEIDRCTAVARSLERRAS